MTSYEVTVLSSLLSPRCGFAATVGFTTNAVYDSNPSRAVRPHYKIIINHIASHDTKIGPGRTFAHARGHCSYSLVLLLLRFQIKMFL